MLITHEYAVTEYLASNAATRSPLILFTKPLQAPWLFQPTYILKPSVLDAWMQLQIIDLLVAGPARSTFVNLNLVHLVVSSSPSLIPFSELCSVRAFHSNRQDVTSQSTPSAPVPTWCQSKLELLTISQYLNKYGMLIGFSQQQVFT